MITPGGDVLQRETAQTNVCTDNDCATRALNLMWARHASGKSCAEVRKSIESKPITDIWGAQVRVICNGRAAQAVSAGHDGKIGTCDDLAVKLALNAERFY